MLHARQDYNERIQDSAHLIPEEEPVFLIRAQDICGPAALRTWIEEAVKRGAADNIIQAARVQLELFKGWRDMRGVKIPDMP